MRMATQAAESKRRNSARLGIVRMNGVGATHCANGR